MTWSLKDIEKLKASGKIRSFKAAVMVLPAKCKKPYNTVRKTPKAVVFIKEALQKAGIAFETEYYFAKPRMFRFDIAIPERMIAIEYEGIVGKSRHTTVTGYTRDATKYNIAASKGWRVYRYTALNYRDFEEDLKKIIT